MFKKFFYILLFWTIGLSAQKIKDPAYLNEQELIDLIDNSSTKERILALCFYQEWSGHKKLTPKRLDNLFTELERIGSTDKEFNRFVDFYKRVSPTMFIPEKDKEVTHKKMIDLYKKAVDYYLASGDNRFAGICLVHSGFDRFMINDYENSIEDMLRGYELLKKSGFENNPVSQKYLHDMSLVFLFFGENEKVVELMNIASVLPPIDINRDIQRFNNLGIAHLALGNRKQAEKAFLMVIERAKKHKVDIWVALAYSKIADLRIKEEKYNQALELYKKAFSLIEQKHNPREYAENALNIAKIYIQTGNTKEALILMRMAQHTSFEYTHYFGEKQQFEKYWSLYYEVNQLYHKATNDYEKAYLYLDSLKIIKLRQDSIYNVLRLYLVKEKLNVQKTLNEKEHIRTRMWTIGIGAFLVIIIVTLLYYVSRIKRGKEKTEHLYKEKVLVEKQEKLSNELEKLKIDLENHLKKITENNRLIEQYKNDAVKEKNNKIDIDNLKILTKEHWENFICDFQTIHEPFYNKVIKQYPDLTQSELRMILLLKLGITQKELPSVLGTSEVNIRVTLHRIRQKIAKKETKTKDKEILVLMNIS